MSPRKRRDPADAWMPPRVYRGKSAYEYHPRDGGAIRLCKLTASPAEVLATHDAVVKSLPAEYSVEWLFRQYEASTQFARLAPVTRTDYQQAKKKPLAVFGKMQAGAVTPPMVRQYLDERGKASQYRGNREVSLLKVVFAWGAERGYLAGNPAAGIKPHPEQRRTRYVTADEYAAVYAEAGPAVRVAMEIAACTGLRRADILAMRWDQVTEDGILITQQKTGTQMVKARSDRLNRALAAARQLPKPKGIVSVYVVHAKSGARYSASGFATVFGRACADAGQDWHFHDLRRTAITDAEGSQVFSGHKSAAMAARYNVKPIKSPSH